MSLVFRPGTEADVPAVARLSWHSFPGPGRTIESWDEWLRTSSLGGVETLLVGEEKGKIVAACRLYDFEQWIGGHAYPIMGLGLVTIAADERRRGLAARMCAAAFAMARERGAVASALYPFRTSFYGNLGYGMAGEALQYRVPPQSLPNDPGRARVSIVGSDADRQDLASFYNLWVKQQTGQIARPPQAWERVWQEGTRGGVLYRDSRGEVCGYAVFRYHPTQERDDRLIEVEEIGWTRREARLGLYGWLSSLSDQWSTVVYRAHPEEGFVDHLAELPRYTAEPLPRFHFWFATASVLNGPMFRLLDLEKAWRDRSVRPGPPFTLALEVQDEQVSANAGTWRLRLAEGRVVAGRGEAEGADLVMKTNIQNLSRIFIGAISPSAAVDAGLITVDRTDRLPDLDQRLRIPRPWMYDRF